MDIAAFNEIKPSVNQKSKSILSSSKRKACRSCENLTCNRKHGRLLPKGKTIFSRMTPLKVLPPSMDKPSDKSSCVGSYNEAWWHWAKSERKERLAENLAIFDFKLDADDTATVSTLDTGTSSFFSHRDPAIVKWMSERKLNID